MKKRKPKFIIKCIIVMILIGAVLPLLTDWFIFGNSFPSAISNSDWSGFLGSLWGGIIGGIGTLISIYISTNDVKDSQEWEKRRDKLERIINASSAYWKEAKIMEKLLIQKGKILDELESKNEESCGINESLRNNPGLAEEKRKGLEIDLQKIDGERDVLTHQIDSISRESLVAVENLFYEKMILHILLEDETTSQEMIKSLDALDNTLSSLAYRKENIEVKILNSQIEAFFSKTKDFLACYEKDA